MTGPIERPAAIEISMYSANSFKMKMVISAAPMNASVLFRNMHVAAIQLARAYRQLDLKLFQLCLSGGRQMCSCEHSTVGECWNGNARKRAANGRCLWNSGVLRYSRPNRGCRRRLHQNLQLHLEKRCFDPAIYGGLPGRLSRDPSKTCLRSFAAVLHDGMRGRSSLSAPEDFLVLLDKIRAQIPSRDARFLRNKRNQAFIDLPASAFPAEDRRTTYA